MHGYVQLDDKSIVQPPCHRRHACSVFCGVLSIGAAFGLCKIITPSAWSQALVLHVFVTPQRHVARWDSSGIVNFDSRPPTSRAISVGNHQIRAHAISRDLDPVQGLLTKTIPSGRAAVVMSPWGSEKIVHGPSTVLRWATIRMFRHYIIQSGDQVVVWDQHGEPKEYVGPAAVNVHPDGDIKTCDHFVLDCDRKLLVFDENGLERIVSGPGVFHAGPYYTVKEFRLVRLASTEAVCIVRQNGTREVVLGAHVPRLFVDPRESLHHFALTGGGDADGFGKEPGFLRFEVLRLQPSQAYLAFPVRTADNAVLVLKLMVFLEITHPELFVLRDDPFAVMFNFIMAETTGLVGGLSFDSFKERPGKRLQEHFASLSSNGQRPLQFLKEQYGLEVSQVVLRGWQAQDREVQRILDQAAAAQTERDVERAKHALALDKLENQREQLEVAAKNFELEARAAEAEGSQDGLRIASLLNTVKSGVHEEGQEDVNVADLARLHIAGQAVGSGGGKLQLLSNPVITPNLPLPNTA